MARPFVIGTVILTIVLILIFVFFGLNLFRDGEDPTEPAADSTPTSSAPAAPTEAETEPVSEPSPTVPAVRNLQGKIRTVDGEPVEDDAFNQVLLLLDEDEVDVIVHLGIEQLIDLDDLGSNEEASDVACLSLEIQGTLPVEATKNGGQRAEGAVDVVLDYVEKPCDDVEPGEGTEEQEATVELVVSNVGTAAGVIELYGGQVSFSAR